MGLRLKPNGFGGEVGLDWGGTRREDGAGVASLLFKDRGFLGCAWE